MKCLNLKTLAFLGLLASLGLPENVEGFIAGGKATGMAATGIAYPQDAYAGAYNPAGIVDVGDRLDFGIDWIQDRGHIRGKNNRTQTGALNPLVNRKFDAFKTKDFYNGDFGINKTFYTEICGNCVNWAAGLVFYNRDFQKTSYTERIVLLGNPLPPINGTNPGLEYLHQTISPVFAININDCLSFGVSVDVHVQRAKVQGLQNFAQDGSIPQLPRFSLYPDKVTNKGYDYSSGVGATIGVKWQISDYLALGVTYRTKAKMSHFHKYKGFLAQRGLLNIPQKVGAGIAWRFLPYATLAFDVEWIDWTQVTSLHNPLINSRVTPPEILTPLGSKHGPGFGFRNQTFYRVGIDYAINDCFTVRAGFRHANSPVRRSQTAVNVLTCDTVENIITVGATYNWNCCAEVSVFYAHGFSKKIKGKDNSIPVFLGGGSIDLVESKNALGISVGYMF
ncbi:MAG: outer membrane protein transport protein [Parachlamydiaceae bacterium]|nr:outer membrane protein transport protein [Parachlamydiaceae bacterium]